MTKSSSKSSHREEIVPLQLDLIEQMSTTLKAIATLISIEASMGEMRRVVALSELYKDLHAALDAHGSDAGLPGGYGRVGPENENGDTY